MYLREKGVKAASPDAYHELLVKLGDRHELRHLNQLGPYLYAHSDVEKTREAFIQKAA